MKLVSLLTLLALCGLFGSVAIGCSEDAEEPVAAALLSIEPWVGGVVPEHSRIQLVFDRDPGELRASAGTISGFGVNRTVTVDAELITLSWDNGGSATLTYTLIAPDPVAPRLISSMPGRGAQDVDPAAINTNGIVLEFDKSIRVAFLLVLADYSSIGAWTVGTSRGRVVLTPMDGAELVHNTAYVVIGMVEDAAGNQGEISVNFTTRSAGDDR